ncbi:MAG: hypothetical protein IJB70_06620 [Clostridia bacterium]|nr:hypothetical protein [Clostridia bacterium]
MIILKGCGFTFFQNVRIQSDNLIASFSIDAWHFFAIVQHNFSGNCKFFTGFNFINFGKADFIYINSDSGICFFFYLSHQRHIIHVLTKSQFLSLSCNLSIGTGYQFGIFFIGHVRIICS